MIVSLLEQDKTEEKIHNALVIHETMNLILKEYLPHDVQLL